MSLSVSQSRVDSLRKDIASLNAKAANERAEATQERSQALHVRNSIRGTMSSALVRSKLAEIERRENKAMAHEKRAVGYDKDAARKGRELVSAQASLDRAVADQQRKEEADQRRRRADELRRIRALEDARRVPPDETWGVDHLTDTARQQRPPATFEYDVCLTFAGEERAYVEMVAAGLKGRGLRVFYDEDEKVTLWGKDLIEFFDYIYRQGSRYCVMFISEAYARKPWTRHERRMALARALEEEGEYILPARFDDTQLPGLPPTVGYLDLREIAPATLVEHIVQKLGGDQSPPDGS